MDVTIACPCPPKADGGPRHEQDTVTLRETLGFEAATAIRNNLAFAKASDPDMSSGDAMALLTTNYLLHGVEAWTLVDLDDKKRAFPVPVTKPEIRARLLADPVFAEPIGEAADELYGRVVLLPLVKRALASSETSLTPESTSPTTDSQAPRRKPSKRSSTSISQTAGTATITSLRGGGSSSSPSSASAA